MTQKTLHYTNGEITIEWKPDICIHSGICFRGLGEVFDPRKKPWIDMTKADTEKIMDQVNQCPSGALSYTTNEKTMTQGPLPHVMEAEKTTTIECLKNGPYLVKETILVKKADGSIETRTGITALCRCGASGTKPYCDGSHNAIDFQG